MSYLGPSAHKVLFEPSECLWWIWGFSLNVISPLLPSCWGFYFAFGHGLSFSGGIQHPPVDGCPAVSSNFGDEHTSFYSAILCVCVCVYVYVCVNFPGGAHGEEPAC